MGYIPRTFAQKMRAVLSELERIADAVGVRCEVISCEESGPYVNLNGCLIVEVPESPEQALAPDSLARRVASALYPENGWHEEELPWSFEAVAELAGSENLLIALLMSDELGTPLLARDPDITRRLMAAGKAAPAAVARRRGAPVKGWPDVEVFYADPADLQRLAASCRALTDAGERFSREECSALLTETLRILCDTGGSADFKRERYGVDRVTFLREKHAEWAELLGSASAIVEVVRAEGNAAKTATWPTFCPRKPFPGRMMPLRAPLFAARCHGCSCALLLRASARGSARSRGRGSHPRNMCSRPSSSPARVPVVSRSCFGMLRRQMPRLIFAIDSLKRGIPFA